MTRAIWLQRLQNTSPARSGKNVFSSLFPCKNGLNAENSNEFTIPFSHRFAEEFKIPRRGFTCAISVSVQHESQCSPINLIISSFNIIQVEPSHNIDETWAYYCSFWMWNRNVSNYCWIISWKIISKAINVAPFIAYWSCSTKTSIAWEEKMKY